MKDVVEVYKDNSGEHRWRRRNGQNRKIVSESGEGYTHKSYAIRQAKTLNEGCEIVDKGKE